MKLSAPENPNYAATVVTLKNIIELENCDNVVGTTIFGAQAIVGKGQQVGDIGIYFPAETQLSEEFCKQNNLFRHSDLNKDKTAAGYIEDNRRVKAMKFRGHRSDALFLSLDSLSYLKLKVADLNEGDTFDQINGHEICKKYLVKLPVSRVEKNKDKVFRRVDTKFLPEHYDTENFFRNQHNIKAGTPVVVTQKLHGTSIRIGNTVVLRKLNTVERILKRMGIKVAETEYDHVSGSKRVIKDPNNPNQNHFYETDVWTTEGQKLKGIIPEGFILYGELIGWTETGAPIQPNYTYRVPQNTADLYIYRVAFVNNQARVTDLTWSQLKEFCRDLGLKHVPELWTGTIDELTQTVDDNGTMAIQQWFMDKHLEEYGWEGIKPGMHAVPLDKDSPCDEGVCVRVDGLTPYILKAKSPAFLRHETEMLDKEVVDIESEQSV